MSADSPKRNKLESLVDKSVSILDRKHEPAEDEQTSPIAQKSVREGLRRNRNYGDLPLALIDPDPDQPRRVDTENESFKELLSSVRAHGVRTPIEVRWIEATQRFQIVAGERRYRASVAAGLESIPAVLRDISDSTKPIIQLMENLQRENLNPIAEARAFRRYLDATGRSQAQLAGDLGKSETYVSRTLSLLDHFSPVEQDQLAGVAPAQLPGKSLILAALEHPDPETLRSVFRGELTRTQVRAKAKKAARPAVGRPRNATSQIAVDDPPATITVRFKTPSADTRDVIRALEAALKRFKAPK
jgi:ParB family chromosome partitioning protein